MVQNLVQLARRSSCVGAVGVRALWVTELTWYPCGACRFGRQVVAIAACLSVRQSRDGDRSRDWSSPEPNPLLHRTRPSLSFRRAHGLVEVAFGVAAVPVSVLFGRSEGLRNSRCGCQVAGIASVVIRLSESQRWLGMARQRGGWCRVRPSDDVRWPRVAEGVIVVRGGWSRHRWVGIRWE